MSDRVWPGHYLDGRTARRQRTHVHAHIGGLTFVTEEGEEERWTWSHFRRTQGAYAGEQTRLEHTDDSGRTLLVDDAEFSKMLDRVAPTTHAFPMAPARRRLTVWVLAASIALVTAGALAYTTAVPALSTLLAPLMPLSWEESLGDSVVDTMTSLGGGRCDAPDLQSAVEEVLARLTAAAPVSRYHFQIRVLDSPMVNAFAAPGGRVVVMRGLLEKTKSAEELAGVLAHETEHVLLHHTTRAILRELSLSAVLQGLTGGGVDARALATARMLGGLSYQRKDETSADLSGLRLMAKAEINPEGMVKAFQMLQAEAPEVPGALSYLSSHPDTSARVDALRWELTHLSHGPWRPLSVPIPWAALIKRCKAPPPEK